MQKVTINLIPLPEDTILEIDLLRFHSVLINLLTNALKFSRSFDEIQVKIGITPVGDNDLVELKIDVTD
jgi:signal transduction histidine kinase